MNESIHWANLFEQERSVINGRGIWLYLVSTSIGNIAIVDYEQQGKEIARKVFCEDYDKAERYYTAICKKILDGKI